MKYFDGCTTSERTVVFNIECYQETTKEQEEKVKDELSDLIYNAVEGKFDIFYLGDTEDTSTGFKITTGLSSPVHIFSCPGSIYEPPTYEETHKYDPEDLRDDIQKQIDSLVGEEVAWVSITVNDVVADY